MTVLTKNPLATPAPAPVADAARTVSGALNFYGSNEGLLVRERGDAHDADSSVTDSGASSEEEAGTPPAIDELRLQLRRRRGASGGAARSQAATPLDQDAYIEHLEDENLRLRERVGLLTQEVRELRSLLVGAPHTDSARTVEHRRDVATQGEVASEPADDGSVDQR